MLPRVFRSSIVARPALARSLTSAAEQRQRLLLKIYAPFAKLSKNSPEYKELALSGKVWEDYHQPADSEKQGYNRLQQVCTCMYCTHPRAGRIRRGGFRKYYLLKPHFSVLVSRRIGDVSVLVACEHSEQKR